MSALEILKCEFDCGDVTRGDGTDVHAMHAGNRAAEPAGPQSPFPSPCEDTEVVGWASDDFGLLHALPLAIPASLTLWAVIAAAWIALQ